MNEAGLHARPAAEFVRAANIFRSELWLIKGQQRFSATSIVEVLTADLGQGDKVTIQAEGPDAEQAVARLIELVRGFDDETYIDWERDTYESLLMFARTVRRDVSDLHPRGMIDIQSFIWVQGSDEYEE